VNPICVVVPNIVHKIQVAAFIPTVQSSTSLFWSYANTKFTDSV